MIETKTLVAEVWLLLMSPIQVSGDECQPLIRPAHSSTLAGRAIAE